MKVLLFLFALTITLKSKSSQLSGKGFLDVFTSESYYKILFIIYLFLWRNLTNNKELIYIIYTIKDCKK